jgi:hypothetical protein
MRTENTTSSYFSPVPHQYSGMPDRSIYSGEGYVPSDIEDRIYSFMQRFIFFCCGEVDDR